MTYGKLGHQLGKDILGIDPRIVKLGQQPVADGGVPLAVRDGEQIPLDVFRLHLRTQLCQLDPTRLDDLDAGVFLEGLKVGLCLGVLIGSSEADEDKLFTCRACQESDIRGGDTGDEPDAESCITRRREAGLLIFFLLSACDGKLDAVRRQCCARSLANNLLG